MAKALANQRSIILHIFINVFLTPFSNTISKFSLGIWSSPVGKIMLIVVNSIRSYLSRHYIPIYRCSIGSFSRSNTTSDISTFTGVYVIFGAGCLCLHKPLIISRDQNIACISTDALPPKSLCLVEYPPPKYHKTIYLLLIQIGQKIMQVYIWTSPIPLQALVNCLELK